MRRISLAVTVVAFLTGLVLVPMQRAEAKTIIGDYLSEKNIDLEISATTDFYSQYIWRGIRLDNDYVIQPGFSISAYGFDLGVWSSFDTDANDGLASTEIDTSLMYTYDFKDLSLFGKDLSALSVSVGHIYYDFPDAGTFSKESVLGFAYDTFLSPSFTWYHDYSRESQGGGHGDYFVLDLSHSLDLVSDYGISLDLGGHVGYNRKLFINGEGGDVGLSAGISLPLTESLTLSPSINYSIPFGDLADAGDGNYEDEFFWGIGLSAAF